MTSYVDPSRKQFDEFKDLPRDSTIMMLNLIRLNKKAKYPDGTEVSGAEAYARYGAESGPIFKSLGGKIIWSGKPEQVLIGSDEERWDVAFIAEYPNSGAFMSMVTNPDYQKVVVYRQAAVADSRLIRMGEVSSAEGVFG